jgi:hypothetical protein
MSLEVHRSRCHHDREWEWSMAANSLIIIEGRKRFASSAFSFVVITSGEANIPEHDIPEISPY